jgi:hypothetical protein
MLLEHAGDARQLGRLPHAFDGVSLGKESDGQSRGKSETTHWILLVGDRDDAADLLQYNV